MRACAAPVAPSIVVMTRLPSGCSRSRGCPGETRSPSSTSHSTTWPPWAAVTPIRSRRLATSPIGEPDGRTSASAASGAMWKVPLAGETTIRQVGEVSISANSPCLSQNARASSSCSGPLSAKVSTP